MLEVLRRVDSKGHIHGYHCRQILLYNTKDFIQPLTNLNLSQCKERKMLNVLWLWFDKIYHSVDSETELAITSFSFL